MLKHKKVWLLVTVCAFFGCLSLCLLPVGTFGINVDNIVKDITRIETLHALAELVQWALIHVLMPLLLGLYFVTIIGETQLHIVLQIIMIVMLTMAVDAVWEVEEKSLSVYNGIYNDNMNPSAGNYFEEKTLDIVGDLAQAGVAGVCVVFLVYLPGKRVRSMLSLEPQRKVWEVFVHLLLWAAIAGNTFIGVFRSTFENSQFVYPGGFLASCFFEIALLLMVYLLNISAASREEVTTKNLWGRVFSIPDRERITTQDVKLMTCLLLTASIIYRAALIFQMFYSYPASYIASLINVVCGGYIKNYMYFEGSSEPLLPV